MNEYKCILFYFNNILLYLMQILFKKCSVVLKTNRNVIIIFLGFSFFYSINDYNLILNVFQANFVVNIADAPN